MKMKKKLFRTVVTILLIGTYTISTSAQTKKSGISRTELQRHSITTSGIEVVQAHIDFEPGRAFGNHNHPVEEIIYVLKVSFNILLRETSCNT
jgi:hypothetical protein